MMIPLDFFGEDQQMRVQCRGSNVRRLSNVAPRFHTVRKVLTCLGLTKLIGDRILVATVLSNKPDKMSSHLAVSED